LVDASELDGLTSEIDPNHVIEIIDHRKINNAEKFPQANIQIELVGAAATLIAEKFFNTHIPISESSAALLFGAIVSNTINFKAKVTTDRDFKMAEWLKHQTNIPETFVHDMFAAKSEFDLPLRDLFYQDYKITKLVGKKLVIIQLEILEPAHFLKQHETEIKQTLQELKTEHDLDYIFVTAIDLERAHNVFVTIDPASQALIEQVVQTDGPNRIYMRKEIMPILVTLLERDKVGK
jgi:inorganic pyrophosphatase/exopolyphosphatase